MDNGQTRYIAGDYTTPYGQCNETMLAKAKHNIDTMFLFIGITEKFDESLILLHHYLGWRKIYYTNKNVTKDKVVALTNWDVELIHKRNIFDIALYEYVSELFGERKRQVPLFKLKCAVFKTYNFMYRFIHPFYKYCRFN